jgi:hypothetical protein
MSLRILYGETKIALPVDLAPFLTSVTIAAVDIVDACFSLKADKTLADDDPAVYFDTLGDNLTLDGTTLTAVIADYTGLLPETKYYIGVGIKIEGDTSFREAPLEESTRTIYFTQDIVRG